MTPTLRSLADFRRFLATPGASLQRPSDTSPRRVVAVRSTFALVDPVQPSRLDLAPASRWRFDGDRAVKVYPDGSVCLSYTCRIEDHAA